MIACLLYQTTLNETIRCTNYHYKDYKTKGNFLNHS